MVKGLFFLILQIKNLDMAVKQTKKEEKDITKAKAIALAIDKMEKDFGMGIIMGAKEQPKEYDVISTGSLGLDKALGVGGLPKGRVVEIFGPESSGKTTLCLEIIKEAQIKGKGKDIWCAVVDAEHALDMVYAEKLGIDLDFLKISQPDYGEQALEIVDRLVKTNAFDVIIVDSVAALVPKSELEGEMGDATMAKQARLMSQALRKLTALVHKANTLLIFTNQIRSKVGKFFGSPETTTGGNALKFYASVRLDVRKIQQIKDGEVISANKTQVKVIKNKVSPPFRSAQFEIKFGEGIDDIGEIIDIATDLDIVHKSGSWFSYKEDRLGQGINSVRELMRDNDELYQKIKTQVYEQYNPIEFTPSLEEAEIEVNEE